MCFGPTPTTVKVEQIENPKPFVENVNGSPQLVVGVKLVFTITDQDGKPVEGTATEKVENLEGNQVQQNTASVPLVDGKGQDLVSNPVGPPPTTQAAGQQAINELNKPFVTRQLFTLTVVPNGGGCPVTVTQERTLTNMAPGAPPLANGQIKGYTFSMKDLKISGP